MPRLVLVLALRHSTGPLHSPREIQITITTAPGGNKYQWAASPVPADHVDIGSPFPPPTSPRLARLGSRCVANSRQNQFRITDQYRSSLVISDKIIDFQNSNLQSISAPAQSSSRLQTSETAFPSSTTPVCIKARSAGHQGDRLAPRIALISSRSEMMPVNQSGKICEL